MLMRVGHRADHAARADAGPSVTYTVRRSARVRSRRRDRRDRGIRGPLAPRAVPVTRSRAQQFDAQVLEAWDRLAVTHPELLYIEIAVSDVPEPDEPALAVFDPADAGLPARITVYRWALELRAATPGQVRLLLRDVLAEQAGVFLGVPPQRLDGGYPRV
jgi:hypothetical protein